MAARILLECGQVSQAEAVTKGALRRIEGMQTPKNDHTTAHKTLAHAAVAQGRWDDARIELARAWTWFERPSEKPITVAELERIARAIERRSTDSFSD